MASPRAVPQENAPEHSPTAQPQVRVLAMMTPLLRTCVCEEAWGRCVRRSLEAKRRAPASAAEDEERENLRRGSWSDWRLEAPIAVAEDLLDDDERTAAAIA